MRRKRRGSREKISRSKTTLKNEWASPAAARKVHANRRCLAARQAFSHAGDVTRPARLTTCNRRQQRKGGALELRGVLFSAAIDGMFKGCLFLGSVAWEEPTTIDGAVEVA
jgi:hypothetical protein